MSLFAVMGSTDSGLLIVAIILAFIIATILARGIRRRISPTPSVLSTFLLGNYVFGFIYLAFLAIIGFGLMHICGPSGMCLLVLFAYFPTFIVAAIVGLVLFFISIKIFPVQQTNSFFTRTEGGLFMASCIAFLIVGAPYVGVTLPSNASATIDSNSLTISTQTPTFSGTAIGVDEVDIEISNEEVGGTALWIGQAHVVNGRWSVIAEIPQNISTINYSIFVLVYVEQSRAKPRVLITKELTLVQL